MEKQYTVTHESLTRCIGLMMPRLDEQNRRIFAAAIANTLGHGGGKVVCDITGLSKPTLTKGRRECAELICDPSARSSARELTDERIRREGGGRKPARELYPDLRDALKRLIDGSVVGNPENPLCWTTKSTYILSSLLKELGYNVVSAQGGATSSVFG